MILIVEGVPPEQLESIRQGIVDEIGHCNTTGEPLVLTFPPGITVKKAAGTAQDVYVYQAHGQEATIQIEVAELYGQPQVRGGTCTPIQPRRM